MEKDYIIAVPLDLWVMDADGSNKRLVLRNGATKAKMVYLRWGRDTMGWAMYVFRYRPFQSASSDA